MAADDAGGEDDLIQTTFAPLASGFPGALGLKDDCAVLNPSPGEDLVLTTDAVAAGVHFFADDAPADIAWKAVAVNVSDLVAKGARPIAYLLAISFPERPSRAWLDGFAAGLAEAQSTFSISLAGGDTDRRPGPLTVSVTAIGAVPQGRMVRRGAARAGDALFLSGTVGDSTLGLRVRQDPRAASFLGVDRDGARALLARYLRPEPRVRLAPHLLAYASAAMDVSDGLAKDCARMAAASGLAVSLDGSRLPLSPPARTALDHRPELFAAIVGGGDDYEVLAAIAPDHAEAFQAAARESGVTVTEIGRFAEGAGASITGPDGRPFQPESTGWDHFPR
jgi:thiamine-monophosphate kinase